MTLIVDTAEAAGSKSGGGWRDFLAGMLNEEWAVGAWDAATGILTVDPFNELNDFRACRRPGCANPASRVDYCPPCQRRARHAGVSVEEYARTHPKVSLDARRTTRGFELCGISDEAGVRCGRAMTTRGLCPTHYDLFAKRCKKSEAALTDHRLEAFVADRVGKYVFPSVPCPNCVVRQDPVTQHQQRPLRLSRLRAAGGAPQAACPHDRGLYGLERGAGASPARARVAE